MNKQTGGKMFCNQGRWFALSRLARHSLLALPFLGSGPAAAEPTPAAALEDLTELPLEVLMEIEIPTVYGASKFEQKSSAAPAAVTVITAEEIKRHGHRTLADVLRSAPGLYVTYDRSYSFLGIGGMNPGDFNGRILLLVNGHRVNNNLSDGAYVGTAFPVDIGLISHVEIIQGPGSVLYGNNAFFGVINVITRQPKDIDGSEVSGEYGSFDSYKARLTYGKAFTNGINVLVSGTYYESGGEGRLFYPEFNTPAQNGGIAENLDGGRFASFFASAEYAGLTLEGAFIHREKENPTAQYGTLFNDPRLDTVDTRGYAALKYLRELPGEVELSARAYYDYGGLRLRYPEPAPLDLFKQEQSGEWAGTEVLLTKRFAGHVLAVGSEYRYDFRQDNKLFQPGTTNVFADVHNTRQNYSAYAQADFAIRTNLHLNVGARFDGYSDFSSTWSPRAALIYDPFARSTIKLVYGTAFRNPNFLEQSGALQELDSEDITSWQLVYEQGIGRHLRSTVSGFYNQVDDLITFQNGAFTNFDAETYGLSLSLEGQWENGIRARASYTIQHAEDRETNERLTDSPEHLVKLNASVPLWKDRLFLGAEVQFVSDRKTSFTDLSGSTLQGADAPEYAILNLTLFNRDLIRNLDVSASLYNVFDTEYYDPSTRFHRQDRIEQTGRSFRLTLSYRF